MAAYSFVVRALVGLGLRSQYAANTLIIIGEAKS
jgi:hypothetical protein